LIVTITAGAGRVRCSARLGEVLYRVSRRHTRDGIEGAEEPDAARDYLEIRAFALGVEGYVLGMTDCDSVAVLHAQHEAPERCLVNHTDDFSADGIGSHLGPRVVGNGVSNTSQFTEVRVATSPWISRRLTIARYSAAICSGLREVTSRDLGGIVPLDETGRRLPSMRRHVGSQLAVLGPTWGIVSRLNICRQLGLKLEGRNLKRRPDM